MAHSYVAYREPLGYLAVAQPITDERYNFALAESESSAAIVLCASSICLKIFCYGHLIQNLLPGIPKRFNLEFRPQSNRFFLPLKRLYVKD